MRKLGITFAVTGALIVAAFARDMRTRGGEIFREVTVTKVELSGLRISHRDGTRFIDFKDLPSELQKEFGYNEQAYLATQAAQAANNERAALIEVQRRATIAATEAQKLADIERQRDLSIAAEAKRQSELAQGSAASLEPSIGQRDYSSRSLGSRSYATRDYTAPRYEAPPAYTPPPSSSGTVQVHGYYRKNGTYVHSYTRHK